MAEEQEVVQRQDDAHVKPKVAWSKEDQAFRVVDAVRESNGHIVTKQRASRKSVSSLEAALKAFESLSEQAQVGERTEELLTMRRELLSQILVPRHHQRTLQWLPDFLSHWWRALNDIVSRDKKHEEHQALVTLVCQELTPLAETEMLMGNITQARAALGLCVRLAREHKLDAQGSIVGDAKRLLVSCIQFHEQLKLCTAGLERQNAPLMIQRELLAMLTQLHRWAPHSVDVMALLVGVLMNMHRPRDVFTLLSTFAFTETDAQLTLLYARALEYEGFYNDSVSTASAFCERHSTLNDDSLLAPLKAHIYALKRVLMSKAMAEDALLQAHYDQAESDFSDALHHIDTKSRKLRAALFLGRANARIALERMLSARHDLEESIACDATNPLTRLRLRTVHLALESQRIQRQLLYCS